MEWLTMASSKFKNSDKNIVGYFKPHKQLSHYQQLPKIYYQKLRNMIR